MDDWPPFAAGLLARSYYLLESVAAVSNREIDAAILTRALYEHVVTFAWIAIDPRKNLPAFFSWEYEERKKAVNDVESIGGIDDDGDWRRALEQFRRMYVPEPVAPAPPMPARAHAAAERWDAITNHGLRPKYSFRGMYPLVYRNFSGHAHPTSRLLLPFIHGSNGVLHVSRPVLKSPLHALGMAPVLFGLALLVASEALQYPKRANVMAAFEAAAGDDDDPDDVSP